MQTTNQDRLQSEVLVVSLNVRYRVVDSLDFLIKYGLRADKKLSVVWVSSPNDCG